MTSLGVVVAVYNGAKTIDAALASIAAQTRQPDVVAVVDDGSTDGTADKVRQWSGVLPIDLVCLERNGGVAAARTVALAHLNTDLVVALDADDVWLPHHLRMLYDGYQRCPGIVTPAAVPWSPEAHTPLDWKRPLQRRPRRLTLRSLTIMNYVFSGALFPRQQYEAVGGLYRFPPAEDWDLWLRMVGNGVAVTGVREPTVLYRISASSLSADDRGLVAELEVLDAFLSSVENRRLRRAARASRRHRHARLALRAAYEHAGADMPSRSRRSAVRALSGTPNVALRAVAMILAPRIAVRRRASSRA